MKLSKQTLCKMIKEELDIRSAEQLDEGVLSYLSKFVNDAKNLHATDMAPIIANFHNHLKRSYFNTAEVVEKLTPEQTTDAIKKITELEEHLNKLKGELRAGPQRRHSFP